MVAGVLNGEEKAKQIMKWFALGAFVGQVWLRTPHVHIYTSGIWGKRLLNITMNKTGDKRKDNVGQFGTLRSKQLNKRSKKQKE
ncbi:hypothetical protein FNV43_RR16787 [Rhamnella rubrinervis]|uniref:Uncharacterized protein n=1 Tax=Rhamnella rubrinervis TaxID=2594499 RepID=A0A8K0GZG3_9ROSA|nr:hypothetical protein FNV43_RR16787 [Rhamnella rubrinervis]